MVKRGKEEGEKRKDARGYDEKKQDKKDREERVRKEGRQVVK